MLLHLHHQVVQVDELRSDGQAAERGLVQDLVETVVVLDQLSESALRGKTKSETVFPKRGSILRFSLSRGHHDGVIIGFLSFVFLIFCN